MFQAFAWAPFFFWIAVVISIILIWKFRSIGVFALFFTLYVAITWNMWNWVSVVFDLAWFGGALALAFYYVSKRRIHWIPIVHYGKLVAGFILVVMLFISGISALYNSGSSNTAAGKAGTPSSASSVPSQQPTGAATTSAPSPTAACPQTWELKSIDHGDNRWFANGLVSIQQASDNAQAAAAAQDWVNQVMPDPALLRGAIQFVLNKDVPVALLQAGNCASSEAKTLASELEMKLATARSITPGTAPSNGTNSGVDNGQVVSAAVSGITGNSKAVEVTFADGRVLWIMARCGNVVTQGSTPARHGKTETQPAPASASKTTHPAPPTTPPVTPPPKRTPPPTTPPSHTTTKPPKTQTCLSVFGPGYTGIFPNCRKTTIDPGGHTVIPSPPAKAPGPYPAPVPVTTTGSNGLPTTQPTSNQCYDPTTGTPVPPGTPGAWCS